MVSGPTVETAASGAYMTATLPAPTTLTEVLGGSGLDGVTNIPLGFE